MSIVRDAVTADMGAVTAIYNHAVAHETSTWDHDPMSLDDRMAWFEDRRAAGFPVLVAEVDGRVVGNAQLTVWGSEGEIGSIVVAESHRRQGLARRLIAALVAEAQARELDALDIGVHRDKPHLRAFYESLGFRPIKKSGPMPTFFEPIITLRLPLQALRKNGREIA